MKQKTITKLSVVWPIDQTLFQKSRGGNELKNKIIAPVTAMMIASSCLPVFAHAKEKMLTALCHQHLQLKKQ